MVEAKKEYLGLLCLVMCPPMIEVFQDMYNEASKISKGRQVLIMFQKLLREVPNWSNAMSKKHSDNIVNRCDHFTNLIAAVFVACTKILSAVRLRADNKKIILKVPTEEVFIQTCYNNIAENLYRDPYIFTDEQSEHIRDEKLTGRFITSIERTVRELIPIQQILNTYMTQESRDIDLDGDVHDSEDPDIYEGAEEEEPTHELMDGMEQSPEELQEMEPMENSEMQQDEPDNFDHEFKTISTVQAPHRVQEQVAPTGEGHETHQEDDVLFGDAPEYRTKNPRYN